MSTLRNLLIAAVVFLLPSSVLTARQAGSLPEGSNIVIRLTDRLSSDSNHTGDAFHAVLDQDLVSDGRVLARTGDDVEGKLVEVRDAGRLSGRARMVLALTGIGVNGAMIPIETNEITVEADSSKKKDVGLIGGGAVLGAIIGAIAGGGKGAAIGAAVGAAAGTGGVLVTGGKDVVFEPEQRFNFITQRSIAFDPRYARSSRYGQARRDSRDRYGNYPYQSAADPGQLSDVARRLSDRVQRVLDLARERRDDYGGSREIDPSILGDIRNFAASARSFSSSSEGYYRGDTGRAEARRLLRDTESIARRLDESGVDPRLRSEWKTVEAEAARLGDYFGLPYPSDRSLARTEPGRYQEYTGGGTFRWRGRVDGSDSIYLTGDRVTVHHISAKPVTESSFDLPAPLPRSAVSVQLRKIGGRGDVELVQQPSASNSYTAVVTIRDDDPGADFYEFELTW